MNILVQPMLSKQELNADSNYVVMSTLLKALLKLREDYYFYIVWPDANSGFKYDDDGFFHHPRIVRLAQRISPRKRINAISFDGVWYDRIFRDIAIDLVWCNLVEIADSIRYSGGGLFTADSMAVVVAAHNYTIHRSLPYPYESMKNIAAHQALGAAYADVNVFNSQHCKRMFQESASEVLHPDMLTRVLDESVLIPYGTLNDVELKAAEKEKGEKNGVPVIAYNHRLQGYKNYIETFDLFKQLHDEGQKFVVHFFNNTTEMNSRIEALPFVRVHLSKTHTEYMRKLAGADLNVTNSQHETFCIAAVESMAFGQPFVAPDGVTFPEITGRDELKYPYLFKTPRQQKEMVVRLLTDARERKKWGEKLRAYVRREYMTDLWAKRYAELFDRLNVWSFDGTPDDTKECTVERLKKFNGKEWNELRQELYRMDVNGRQAFANQSLSPTRAVRFIRYLGGDIVIKDGKQVVVYEPKESPRNRK